MLCSIISNTSHPWLWFQVLLETMIRRLVLQSCSSGQAIYCILVNCDFFRVGIGSKSMISNVTYQILLFLFLFLFILFLFILINWLFFSSQYFYSNSSFPITFLPHTTTNNSNTHRRVCEYTEFSPIQPILQLNPLLNYDTNSYSNANNRRCTQTSTNNNLQRTLLIESNITISFLDYIERMETQNTNILWAKQV